MKTLNEILVRDLTEIAGFLTEPGMTQAQSASFRMAPLFTIGGTIRAAETLAGWSRHLLSEVAEESLGNDRLEITKRPSGAFLPKNPAGWDLSGEVPTPTFWLTHAPLTTLNTGPLHWLKHIIERTEERLESLKRRITHHRESIEVLRTTSYWVERDIAQADEISARLNRAIEVLRGFKRTIDMRCAKVISPRPALPRPFPSGRTWQTLRRFSHHWLEPSSASASLIKDALSEASSMAETPFLYQRWSTYKLLEGFEALGHRPVNREDALWAIFLGGHIPLGAIDLYVEPHLGPHSHPCGLLADSAQSPDLVINIQSRNGIESIALDPTLSQDSERLREKGRYLETLRRIETRRIAGVAVVKRPKRSWAISPTNESSCRLLGVDEKCGVIPMNPFNYKEAPLGAFLSDILDWI